MTHNPRTHERARVALSKWVAKKPADRDWREAPHAASATEGFVSLEWQTKWVRPTIVELADAVAPGWDKDKP